MKKKNTGWDFRVKRKYVDVATLIGIGTLLTEVGGITGWFSIIWILMGISLLFQKGD